MVRIQKFHVCFPKAFDCTDVFPVAVESVRKAVFAVLKVGRNDVLAEIFHLTLFRLILHQIFTEHLPVEDVDTHRCQIAFRLFWLLIEFDDAVRLIRIHDPEAGCFFHRNRDDADSQAGMVRFMEIQHMRVVHLVDMVTGQYQDIFRIVSVDIGDILINGMRSSLEPLFAISTRIRLQNRSTPITAIQSP